MIQHRLLTKIANHRPSRRRVGAGRSPAALLVAAFLLLAAGLCAAPAAAVLGFSPVGSEFRVNTTTAGAQWPNEWSVRVYGLQPDGSLIAVWVDAGGNDGQAKGIYMQRFDPAGAKIGVETLVNTNTSGDQDAPSLAVAPDGSFVIAWFGPGTSLDVFAQRFTAAGVRFADEFLLNQSTSGNQKYPEIIFKDNGEMVAAYVDDAATTLQRYDGAMKSIGFETRITGTGGNVVLDSIEARADGSLIVTWTESEDVWFQLFSAELQPLPSTPIPVRLSIYTAGVQQYSVARADADGNFVVVWESAGQDGSGNGVYARRLWANGTPRLTNGSTNEFLVPSVTANDQYGQVTVVHPSGNFLVVWADNGNRDGGGTAGGVSGTSVWMKLYDTNGTAISADTRVNVSTTEAQDWPVAAMNYSGQFVIGWEGNGTQVGQVDSSGAFGRRYTLNQTGTTTLSVTPTLTTAGDLVTVTMSLTATDPTSVPNVLPNPLTVSGTNGVFATLVSGPTPGTAVTVNNLAPPETFTWTYRVTALGQAGQLTFGGNADDHGEYIWPYAASAAITVRPTLFLRDLTAPNLVGDSNVFSQPDQGPRVFTIGTEVCSANTTRLDDVVVRIGDGTTPGTFPTTTMSLGLTNNTYQGDFSLDLLANSTDATRTLISLDPAKVVIDGRVDCDASGAVTTADDCLLSNGLDVIDGLIDANDDGVVNFNDDSLDSPGIFDGFVDIDNDNPRSAPPYAYVADSGDDGVYGGECQNLYWQVAYQVLDAAGEPTWGNNQALPDDLRYFWTVWGSARLAGEAQTRSASLTDSARVRNEISAQANKIQPGGNPGSYIYSGPPRIIDGWVDVNQDGQITTADDGGYAGKTVIDGGLDINGSGTITVADDGTLLGFPVIDGRFDTNGDGAVNAADDLILVQPGQIFSVVVFRSTFGTIGQGFDENRDGLWDYDFWHQPVGELNWNASAFRMVDTYSDITGTGGSCPLQGVTLHFDNEPYLSRIFNGDLYSCGFDAVYTYTFLALGPGGGVLSPYQEAASGQDNEKYNGDYCDGSLSYPCLQVGTGTMGLDLEKAANGTSFATGDTVTWTLTYTNVAFGPAGDPLSGNGVAIQDAIPPHTTYVGGSASCAVFPCTIYYSTDQGANWTSLEPVVASTVTHLLWHIDVPVPADNPATPGVHEGRGTVSFQTRIVAGTPDSTRVTNVGEIGIYGGPPLDRAEATVLVRANVVGDLIWLDTDSDGVYDIGEPGLPNVTVCLRQGGLTIACTSTDSNGRYLFTDVPAGAGYFVDVTAGVPAGLILTPGSTDPTATFSLTAGQSYLDADVGYTGAALTAVIGDYVWRDVDGDGVQDAGEAGLGGVTVQLRNSSGAVVDTTTTSADGKYLFVGVAPGTYTVAVPAPPVGYTATVGPESEGGNVSTPIAVLAGDVYVTADFGYDSNALFSISDTLWVDVDGDGVKDANETTGLAGVTVALKDANGNIIATATTGANGGFTFPGVPSGNYTIEITDTTNVLGGYAGTTASATAGQLAVTVAGANVSGTHFGYNPPGIIGDLVWVDTNQDGLRSAGEAALGGVAVRLYLDRDNDGVFEPGGADGAPVATTLSGPDGSYRFSGLADGRYFVSVDGTQAALSGYTLSTGTPDEVPGVGGAEQISALSGSAPTTGTIGDFVFQDADRDGAQDPDEPGIAGVTLRLYRSDSDFVFEPGTGDVLVASAVTDVNGSYRFHDLPAGSYWVDVDQTTVPAGLAASTLEPLQVYLGTGENYPFADFGYKSAVAASGALGDRVWYDADSNGLQDAGEVGVAGVTVSVQGVSASSCKPAACVVTTDPDGSWLVAGLTPGTYTVTVTVPVGMTGTTSTTRSVTLTALEDLWTVDFGLVASNPATRGTIGDLVFYDADADGLLDANETGIAGVTLNLYRSSDNRLVGTTVTDANGAYHFYGLPDGAYVVEVTDVNDVLGTLPQTADPTQPGGLCTSCDQRGSATISGGNTVSTVDFGYSTSHTDLTVDFGYRNVNNADLSGTVWSDVNRNGVLELGEAGFAGVTVAMMLPGTVDGYVDINGDGVIGGADDGLYGGYTVTDGVLAAPNGTYVYGQQVFGGRLDVDGNGAVDTSDDQAPPLVATTTTNASGDYTFLDVPQGSYNVVVTDEADVLNGYTLTSGLDVRPVVVPANGSVTDIDFGYARNIDTGAIGGQAWLDANNDGVRSLAEETLAGVAVRLINAGTTPLVIDGVTYAPGATIATTTTDASGGYFFSGLPAGTFEVQVTGGVPAGLAQSGDPDATGSCLGGPTCDGRSTVALSDGQIVQAIDFGYTAGAGTVVLGDTVWYDGNGNGQQDGGEVGLAGVTVVVLDQSTGAVVAQVVTAADGSWLVTGLPSGVGYTVYVDRSTLPSGVGPLPTNLGGGDTYVTPVLASGQVLTSLDFGYAGGTTGSVGDEVFLDANANGVRDAGEGLAGVGLRLYTDLDGPDDIPNSGDEAAIATTVTDTNGRYEFVGLPAGTYYVLVDDLTLPNGGAGLTLTAGSDPTGAIVLAGGATYSLADFGYRPAGGTAAIGDRIWSDADGDGVQDAGEAGVGGVLVQLRDGGNNLVAQVLTDADGSYLFANLAPGTYSVVVAASSFAGGQPLFGAAQTGDPDQPGVPCTTCDHTDSGVVVAAGGAYLGSDFGYNLASDSSIGDTVYRDQNGDGDQDVGEFGLAGVTLNLLNASGVVVATTTTNASGQYSFTGLPAGTYRVVVTDRDHVLAGLLPTETEGSITLGANQNFTTADFGFDDLAADGSIGDTVYFDADGDGTRDLGEAGISGVTLNLIDLDAGGIVIASATTDANGLYLFDGLGAGNYRVVVTDRNQVVANLSLTAAAPNPIVITCASPCTDVTNADFGYAPTTGGTGTLGGTVWLDTQQPGGVVATLQAGEPGIPGTEVELWLDVNGDGAIQPGTDNLVRTTLTDANGNYLFLAIPAGNYVVRVPDNDDPNVDGNTGVLANPVLVGLVDVQGPAPTVDSNGHFNPYAVTLLTGQTNTTVDFAYQATTPYAISGTIFEDNGSVGTLGTNDGPTVDPAVPGATVLLYRVVGGVEYLFDTTLTDINGDYSFSGLPAGDYVVRVDVGGTFVAGFTPTADYDASDPGETCSTCDSQAFLTLGPGVTDVDFGYWNNDVITTPVTLAYFKATPGAGQSVRFVWWTAVETQNVGFRLYVESGGRREPLARGTVASRKITSDVPQEYGLTLEVAEGKVFWLSDVASDGRETLHGPFALGKPHGHLPKMQAVDWQKIGREHRTHKTQRGQARLAAAQAGVRAAVAAGGSAAVVNLMVAENRVYRVPYEAILAAGVDLDGVPVNRLALAAGGASVPMRVQGGAKKGFFGRGGFIEFLGRAVESLHTRFNPYQLSVGLGSALRVEEDGTVLPAVFTAVPHYLETVRVERQANYDWSSPAADPWYDTTLLAWGGPASAEFTFSLDNVAVGVDGAALNLGLWGVTDFPVEPDHHMVAEVNGYLAASERFNGRSNVNRSVPLSVGTLREGVNTLTVELPFDLGPDVWFDMVNIDHYGATYPRRFVAREGRLTFTSSGPAFTVSQLPSKDVVVYRVDASGLAVRLAGVRVRVSADGGGFSASFPGSPATATYHVVSQGGLAAPTIEAVEPAVDCANGGAADYLVIAHDQFLGGALDRLVAYRRSEGHGVAVVPAAGLYERYSHGRVAPEALQACVRDAARARGTKAVLLVGGASYDSKNYLGLGSLDFLPTFYAATDAIVRFAPSDALVGDVDGDRVQDVAVGRWPVRTAAELASIVEQTLAYEAKSGYDGTAVFAADRYDGAQGYDFGADADAILAELPGGWQATKAYVDELGVAGASQRLLSEMNRGTALTAYVGHSYQGGWSFEGLLTTDQVAQLANAGRPTVVVQMGCWNTYFVSPWADTLGHRFLLSGDRGAAAVLGASTLTEATNEADIARRLVRSSVGGLAAGETLGEALLRARRAVAAEHPERLDVVLGWQLLGDPLLRVVQ